MHPTPSLPPAQFAALMSSDGPARFKHFIGRVADSEVVWGLRNGDGWVMLADDTGSQGFAVWPHPDYAAACATESWSDCSPAAISVHEFTEEWLPDMADKQVAVAVFPTPSMKGVWMEATELQHRLSEELDKYA